MKPPTQKGEIPHAEEVQGQVEADPQAQQQTVQAERVLKPPRGATRQRAKLAEDISTPEIRRGIFAQCIAAGKTLHEAAREAGYSGTDHVLSQTAYKLMKRPDVQALIAEANNKANSARVMAVQEIRERWTKIGRGESIATYITKDGNAIPVPPDMSDQLKALEGLAKAHGMFIEKSQQDVRLEITIRRGADAPAALPPPKDNK